MSLFFEAIVILIVVVSSKIENTWHMGGLAGKRALVV